MQILKKANFINFDYLSEIIGKQQLLSFLNIEVYTHISLYTYIEVLEVSSNYNFVLDKSCESLR